MDWAEADPRVGCIAMEMPGVTTLRLRVGSSILGTVLWIFMGLWHFSVENLQSPRSLEGVNLIQVSGSNGSRDVCLHVVLCVRVEHWQQSCPRKGRRAGATERTPFAYSLVVKHGQTIPNRYQ